MTAIAPAMVVPSVRLWRVSLDAFAGDSERDDEWLSPSEEARASAFVFAADAARYRASHRTLRRLLYRDAGWPKRAEFALGSHGKPTLGPAQPGFNLSRSGASALIGIADARIGTEVMCGGVGVDIEHWHPIDDLWRVADEVLAEDERAALSTTPAERLVDGFLRCWTRKEACLKALGSGLSIAPGTFSVGLGPQPSDVSISTDQGEVAVRVQSVDAGRDVLAAVAMTIGLRDRHGIRLSEARRDDSNRA